MQRISTLNAVLNLFGLGKSGFRDGNKALNLNPTEFSAAWCNAIQEELAAIPESIGAVLDPNNNGQVLASIIQLIIQGGAPGIIGFYAANAIPTGWLKCNGALVSRTTYANLFAKIGTVYGVGDGATTFALPDFRGEFLRGFDDGRGIDTGRVFGSLQSDQLQGHQHAFSLFTNAGTGSDAYRLSYAYAGAVAAAATWYASEGVKNPITDGTNGTPRTGSESRPRNVAVLICIKY